MSGLENKHIKTEEGSTYRVCCLASHSLSAISVRLLQTYAGSPSSVLLCS